VNTVRLRDVQPITSEIPAQPRERRTRFDLARAALAWRFISSRLVLTGVAADICVRFTPADAHKREYPLWMPSDAVAGENDRRIELALAILRAPFDVAIRPMDEFALEDWVSIARDQPGQGN
jgi:hypothetical protein